MSSESASRLKRVAAGSLATAVAITGLGLAAAPATAAPAAVRVHLAEIGQETSSYPAGNKWFIGASSRPGIRAAIVNDKLVMKPFTQVLTQLKGTELPATVAEIITEGVEVGITDSDEGDVALQIALGWQGAGNWTTLRPGVQNLEDLDPADPWISSKPIGGVGGLTTGTLGELAAAIDASVAGTESKSFAYAAVGALVNNDPGVDTSIDSITVNAVPYVFVDGLPAASSTTKVQLSDIGTETAAGYPATSWFYGAGAATAKPTVVGGNLVLPAKKQLLHAVSGVTSLRSLVSNGLAVTTTEASVGSASLQIAAGWTGGWTTLRPAATTNGENVADFGAEWISSKALTGGVTTGTLDQLVGLIDTAAAGSFTYVAVGAFADTSTGTGLTTVSSLQVGTSKTVFANEAKIVASVAVTGVKAVGNTLTASVTANYTGTTKTYQWYRDGKAIKNATRSTYAPGAADLNTRITVVVTLAKAGLVKKAVTSPKIVRIALGTLQFRAPANIAGTPKVGVKLTASGLAWGEVNEKPASGYSYIWYRNDVAIKGATAKTYVPVFADLGKVVSVKVVAKLAGYASTGARNEPVAAVVPGTFVLGTPKIVGKRVVGQTLVVAPGAWSAAPTLRYAFFADGELIQYSTSPKLLLTWEHKGHSISVEVTGSKQGYITATTPESPTTAPIK
ncbi:hypothetical protein EYE40_13235 [Glaciihabitans arcticus]|uniref:Ig-like domain repeat protein n=1 Tax=Glaciihabitans arcticus TaxID=2668039 RepID=A0A4Q9H0Q8_9MICO|nr:hypothetical protein [Glaciihabitans arcticus]TBN58280.1 hypothetical protein EYE40_13235 [Glaciihabitans arcticus]